MIADKEIKTEKSNSKKGDGTILIVDDDHSIRRVLEEYLNSKGFETHGAVTADAGLEILNQVRVDLVITNIRMPGMDGIEFTRMIKEKYESNVIIMTGYHSYTLEDAVRVGACDLLHKPAKLEDLLASISRILSQ